MKKAISLIMIALMLLCLISCGGSAGIKKLRDSGAAGSYYVQDVEKELDITDFCVLSSGELAAACSERQSGGKNAIYILTPGSRERVYKTELRLLSLCADPALGNFLVLCRDENGLCSLSQFNRTGNLMGTYSFNELPLLAEGFARYVLCTERTLFLMGGGRLCAVDRTNLRNTLYTLEAAESSRLCLFDSSSAALLLQDEEGSRILLLEDGKQKKFREIAVDTLLTDMSAAPEGLYLNDGSGIYYYDTEEKSAEKLLDWSETPVYCEKYFPEENGFICLGKQGDSQSYKLFHLLKADESPE